MKVGYARTSTLEQVAGFEAQLEELKAHGCEKVYKEQVSSVEERQELSQALDYLREGDSLVVTKLDRLARSMRHLGEIVEAIKAKGAHLQILNLGIDTSNATGELVLNLLGAVSQFERQIMLERQREGIAKAKSEGKYKGRKPTARAKADEVNKLVREGKKPTEIAKELGIGRASVYRILKY
ncbi:recombinase family protein [Sneathiella sp. CAU 1612]|uniref:Recombinase family protein n=1 Tax=Sneathiella sedimenti TaxID=2816034 RepID=A0ABS3F4P6_9PROT|nr:recombinase family protein [Sneathiella sedimenti]MBO0333494.1 recombinase family protein [Sneathiella sedimenti]